MELERLLASQGFGTRRYCRQLILSSRVSVRGLVLDDPSLRLDTEGLVFSVDGEEWTFRKFAYLMLNKPGGYECSRKPGFHPSIYSLLPPPLLERGVQSVGRLDEDTTGLLLFSDDGQFIHTYTSPRKKVIKVYEAEVKHDVTQIQIGALLAGVALNDEPAPIAATRCEMVSERLIRLTVTEGKYHLVKRMIAAAGNRVVSLKRIQIGSLCLPADLVEGRWRWLEDEDMGLLFGRNA